MQNPNQILVVEDEMRWREDIFREILEDAGYLVATCDSYNAAISRLRQKRYNLAVVDVNLTGVSGNQDGIRLLEWLASHHRDTVVIVVSGSKTRAMAEESVKQFQPLAFVDKTTFDLADFLSLVAQALA